MLHIEGLQFGRTQAGVSKGPRSNFFQPAKQSHSTPKRLEFEVLHVPIPQSTKEQLKSTHKLIQPLIMSI